VEIREFAIADYEEVLALWQASEGIGLGASDTREAIAAFLARNPALCFVVREGDALVGSVLCGHDGRRAYVHHLAVAVSHRRRGIGRLLAARCLAALGDLGIARCHLFVFRTNTAARAFWEREGWWERDDLWMMTRDVIGGDAPDVPSARAVPPMGAVPPLEGLPRRAVRPAEGGGESQRGCFC
jgi:ribosomal protein S18 acetylase RimI-like enzyme